MRSELSDMSEVKPAKRVYWFLNRFSVEIVTMLFI